MTAMVEVRNLSKRYPGASDPAVDGVSFEIERGEVFSLLGPNGAGKTTTISVLSCLLSPTSGEARVGGHSVQSHPMAVKRLLGVVPQDLALYEPLSARENLIFWGKMYGMAGAELKRRVDRALEQVGLRQRGGDRVETFSGGMKRRLNIAVGLLHRPELVILDEPTVGIDPQSRRSILDSVKELNQAGMTVLYTTHYMEEAQELSHRIGVMDHGKLISLGALDELVRLVGQKDQIELQVAEEHAPAALVSALEASPLVSQVRAADGTLHLLVDDADRALPEVVAATARAGVKLASVQVREPNLEAVFLHLTGRGLRD